MLWLLQLQDSLHSNKQEEFHERESASHLPVPWGLQRASSIGCKRSVDGHRWKRAGGILERQASCWAGALVTAALIGEFCTNFFRAFMWTWPTILGCGPFKSFGSLVLHSSQTPRVPNGLIPGLEVSRPWPLVALGYASTLARVMTESLFQVAIELTIGKAEEMQHS